MLSTKIKELEEEYTSCSSLLRVQTFVKQLKKEQMSFNVLEDIAETYFDIERLKLVNEKLDALNKASRLSRDKRHKRDMLERVKVDMIAQIGESNRNLENNTHFMTTDSSLLSVIHDLDVATFIFKEKVGKDNRKR